MFLDLGQQVGQVLHKVKSRHNIQKNPDFSNPHFFEPPDNSNQKVVPSPQSNTVIFTSDFSANSPISRTNLRFPWRFEKSGFHCITCFISSQFTLTDEIYSFFYVYSVPFRLINIKVRVWGQLNHSVF